MISIVIPSDALPNVQGDFELNVQLPSGVKCTILVPADFSGYGRLKELAVDDSVYGLNLVCSGHYT